MALKYNVGMQIINSYINYIKESQRGETASFVLDLLAPGDEVVLETCLQDAWGDICRRHVDMIKKQNPHSIKGKHAALVEVFKM